MPKHRQKRVTPHTLRHSKAMDLLHHGVDPAVIGLWLGHENVETTQIYIHADMRMKEKALARHPVGPLPARRPAPRIPGRPLIMPNSCMADAGQTDLQPRAMRHNPDHGIMTIMPISA